mgnify:CR=1 FL=1
MNIWKYILIIIIIIYFLIIIRFNNKTNNEYTIYQMYNPSKEVLEDNLSKLSPSIITNSLDNYPEISKINIDFLKQQTSKNLKISLYKHESKKSTLIYSTLDSFLKFIEQIKETSKLSTYYYILDDQDILKKIGMYDKFNTYANYYLCPWTIMKNYKLSIEYQNFKSDIFQVDNNRLLILHLEGSRKYYLFNPDQQSKLYPSNKYNNGYKKSLINFWDTKQNESYPLFKDSQYMEISIYPGQILYIPNKWWYCYQNIDNNMVVKIESTFFSNLVEKSPKIFKYLGHKMGF